MGKIIDRLKKQIMEDERTLEIVKLINDLSIEDIKFTSTPNDKFLCSFVAVVNGVELNSNAYIFNIYESRQKLLFDIIGRMINHKFGMNIWKVYISIFNSMKTYNVSTNSIDYDIWSITDYHKVKLLRQTNDINNILKKSWLYDTNHMVNLLIEREMDWMKYGLGGVNINKKRIADLASRKTKIGIING